METHDDADFTGFESWIGNAAAGGEWRLGRGDPAAAQSVIAARPSTNMLSAWSRRWPANKPVAISYEDLWAEKERLKAENAALWQAWSETEDLRESKQRELASAGSAMGLSLTQIVVLLAIVLPSRMVPSRATVGRWVQQSAQQSRGILEVLDRACQGLALVLCLDEIFFHREPF